MQSDAISDETAMNWLRATMAANDREYILWPPENTQFATKILLKARGRIPSIEDVISEIGEERAQNIFVAIIENRKFQNLSLGYRYPCHYCESTDDLKHHDFALMNVDKTNRKWGETAASIALSAALFPVLGGGMVRLPGRSFQGAAIHLRLVVCKACRKKNGNIFGAFFLDEKKAAKHPLWDHLIAAGYRKFLAHDKLPNEFKYQAGITL